MNCHKEEYDPMCTRYCDSGGGPDAGLDEEDKDEIDGEEIEEDENEDGDGEEDCDEDTIGNREGSEDENEGEGDMDIDCPQGEPAEVESDKRTKKKGQCYITFNQKTVYQNTNRIVYSVKQENDSGYCYDCYPEIKKITKPKFYLDRIENRKAKIRAYRQSRSRRTLNDILKSSTELHLRIQKPRAKNAGRSQIRIERFTAYARKINNVHI